jgi:hypothetical protein
MHQTSHFQNLNMLLQAAEYFKPTLNDTWQVYEAQEVRKRSWPPLFVF